MATTNIASPNILIPCFLLLLCTFSTSTPVPIDSSDVDQFDLESFFDEQDAIFLPSQNLAEPDSHPAQQTTHHHPNIDKPTKTQSSEESKPLPLTVFRFGPLDRSRFQRHPLPLSSGLPVRHRCHHTHRHYKPGNKRHLPGRDNDDVTTIINDLNKEFDAAGRGGEVRDPDDWMRFEDNINEPISLSRKRSKAMEKSELLKRIHTRYNQLRREEAEKKKIKDNGSTVVKRIRKFLNGV